MTPRRHHMSTPTTHLKMARWLCERPCTTNISARSKSMCRAVQWSTTWAAPDEPKNGETQRKSVHGACGNKPLSVKLPVFQTWQEHSLHWWPFLSSVVQTDHVLIIYLLVCILRGPPNCSCPHLFIVFMFLIFSFFHVLSSVLRFLLILFDYFSSARAPHFSCLDFCCMFSCFFMFCMS